jgi:error-prone DNA polymerase
MSPLLQISFSFLEGASQPEELIEAAPRAGLPAIALTDRDGVYGIVEATSRRARRDQAHRRLRVSIDDGSTIVLLATDRAGYANLCQLITVGGARSEKGTSVVGWREVYEHAPGLDRAVGRGAQPARERARSVLRRAGLKEAFGDRLYALAARTAVGRAAPRSAAARRARRSLSIPVVAAHEVLYHTKSRAPLQDVFTALRTR